MRQFGSVILPCVLLALPFVVGRGTFAHFGASPHNDDFLYARCSQILADEGRYQHVSQDGRLAASVASHSVWGALVCWPLGFSYSNLHLSVAIAAWIGAMCVFGTARRLGCPCGAALLLATTLTVGPYYYGMSFTFMTDVTAIVFASIGVLGYLIGIQKSSLGWLAAGAIGTTLAMWARQTHLVTMVFAIVALAGVAWERREWSRLWLRLLIACGIPILGYVAFEFGWIVPGNQDRITIVHVRHYGMDWLRSVVLNVYSACVLTGFVLLPILPQLIARMKAAAELQPRQRWIAGAVAIVTAGLLLTIFAVKGGRIYITQATGYILHNGHYGPILLADHADSGRWSDMGGVQWPALFWQVLTVGAIGCVGVMTWWAAVSLMHPEDRTKRWCNAGLLAAAVASVIGLIAVVETVYDRYWMLLYPFLFVWLGSLLAARRERTPAWTWAVSLLLLAGMFAMSFVMTHDFLAWNQARWDQVQRWQKAGLRPEQFDAGNGINGWFLSAEDHATHPRPGDETIYWRGLATEALSIGPREGWTVQKEIPWYSWAIGRECRILVIRRESDLRSGHVRGSRDPRKTR